ncbi:YidC/Oxa1 family membrane protein insertase, partial [Patescibacteria group bacterium]
SMNQSMLYFMPVITVVIGVSLPGGLTLYWVTVNIVSILQQKIAFKKKDEPVLELGQDKSTVIDAQAVPVLSDSQTTTSTHSHSKTDDNQVKEAQSSNSDQKDPASLTKATEDKSDQSS